MLNREDYKSAIPQLEKMIKEVGNNVVDGKTSYLHIAYANNSTGTDGFSTTYSIAKSYLGQYSDFEEEASTIPSKYSWTLIKGDTGAQGEPGTNGHSPQVTATRSGDTVTIKVDDVTIATVQDGTDGTAGTPGAAGADGKTSYLHIAYATNATGTAGFSTTDPVGKTYIGQYTDFVAADSTDPANYSWTLIKGATGATGPSGTVISDTAPADTTQLWLDTSGETDVLKENDGTSWAEIPVETKAVEAAKTATDFLEDSAGTTIIKNTSQTSNAKAVVGENSFDIIKDGDTVATFGESAQVGGSSDNVRISSGGIQFMVNNTAAAYVSADKMYAQNIETAGALYFKHYSIKEDTDGKLVIYKR